LDLRPFLLHFFICESFAASLSGSAEGSPACPGARSRRGGRPPRWDAAAEAPRANRACVTALFASQKALSLIRKGSIWLTALCGSLAG